MIPPVVDRLVAAINSHDIDALVACFAPSFSVEWPVHPARSFDGTDQVRRNWTAIFEARPTIQAKVTSHSSTDGEFWGEWEFAGDDRDGVPFCDRGVIIITAGQDAIVRSRFYMEPVDQ
jgi:ketosteroid isomerase-like protein